MKDKLFNYLISRVQARESSYVAVSAIASSASLVILGIFLLKEYDEKFKDMIWWLGFLFPIISIVYFESVFSTQQKWDYDEIKKMIKEDNEMDNNTVKNLDKIIYGKRRSSVLPKIILWKILLWLPVVGWLFAVFHESIHRITILFVISIIIIIITIISEQRKN